MVVATTVGERSHRSDGQNDGGNSVAATGGHDLRRSARREALADASAGVIGSLVSMLVLYPVDVWKTNAQAGRDGGDGTKSSDETSGSKSYMEALGKHCRLFRGVEVKAAHTGASTFAYFFLHSWLQSQHKAWSKTPSNREYRPSTSARLMIAALAAASNTLLTLPLDVLAARRQTDTATPSSRHPAKHQQQDDCDEHDVEDEGDELDDGDEGGDEKKDDDCRVAVRSRSSIRAGHTIAVSHDHSDVEAKRRAFVTEGDNLKPLLKSNSTSESAHRHLKETSTSGKAEANASTQLLARLDDAWNDQATNPEAETSEKSPTAEEDVPSEEKSLDVTDHDDATAVTDNTANREPRRRVRFQFQDDAQEKPHSVHSVPPRRPTPRRQRQQYQLSQRPRRRRRKSPPCMTDPNFRLPSRPLPSPPLTPARGGASLLDLYSGLWPSLLLCSNPAINFTAYDVMKSVLLRSPRRGHGHRQHADKPPQQLSMMEAFVLGFLAKFVATIVTYPLIRAKVLLMVRHEFLHHMDGNRETATTTSLLAVWTILRRIVQTEGVTGLYRGCNLQLIHTILKSALMMMVRERITSSTRQFFLGAPNQQQSKK